MLERVLGVAAALPFLLGAAAAPVDHEHVVFRFQDQRIDESSDLVVLGGGLFATANDSGDTGRVFVLDARGETVGLTQWEEHPTDVEALAPAPGGRLWVGDIGDNLASRPSIQVAEVTVGRGDRTEHPTPVTLTYPDGPHDAETLLGAPDGHVYIATKGFLGGHLYAAPFPLRDGTLTQLPGDVIPMATDGVFLPGGRQVLIRNYNSLALYDFPSMQVLGTQDLPLQKQGEGIGYAASGTLYLSSEGIGAPVVSVRLHPTPVRSVSPSAVPTSPAGGHGTGTAGRPPASTAEPVATEETRGRWWPWLTGGGVLVAMVVVLVRAIRPR